MCAYSKNKASLKFQIKRKKGGNNLITYLFYVSGAKNRCRQFCESFHFFIANLFICLSIVSL